MQKVKTRKKHKCPPHHWIINSVNVGRCIYCLEVQDFGGLLRKAGVPVCGSWPAIPVKPNRGGGRKKKEEL